MNELFLRVLSMSVTASYVILFVLAARLLLKKAPKGYSYALWSVAMFRLCCPFSFESVWSLLPVGGQAVSPDILHANQPQIASGIVAIDRAVNGVLPAATPNSTVNPMRIYVTVGAVVWALIAVGMVLYGLPSAARLARRLKSATRLDDNQHETASFKTLFVFGFPAGFPTPKRATSCGTSRPTLRDLTI